MTSLNVGNKSFTKPNSAHSDLAEDVCKFWRTKSPGWIPVKELAETMKDLEWWKRLAEKLAADCGHIEDLWKVSQQQVKVLREALERTAGLARPVGIVSTQQEGTLFIDAEELEDLVDAALKATSTTPEETEPHD